MIEKNKRERNCTNAWGWAIYISNREDLVAEKNI